MNINLLHTRLAAWWEMNHRILPWRETSDPYKIWVSEIILQQTRVSQGMEYYLRFIDTFPTIEALAQASEDEVLRLWQGLGYYSRARNMHKAARIIVADGHGFPTTLQSLRTLPGIGDYTAGAILSFAYNLPYPALDGNVYRVLARLYDSNVVFDTTHGKNFFHSIANELLDKVNPRVFNSAIMEFGALYCTPTLNGQCSTCPLEPMCLGAAHGTAALLPLRKPKQALKNRYFLYTIYLTPNRHTLIHQRCEKDIWQHLYEFPLIETCTTVNDIPQGAHILWKGTHVLSHQRIHATFLIKTVDELPLIENTIPIKWEEIDNYAFSRLTLRAIAQSEHNEVLSQ